MAPPFATVFDLREHWAQLPLDEEESATQKLAEASIEVRGLYRNIDARINRYIVDSSDTFGIDPDTVKLVVCRMVKRAMDVSEDDALPAGLETFQFGAGPFNMSGKASNPDGNIYLSAGDKRLLSPSRSTRKAWTIHPGG